MGSPAAEAPNSAFVNRLYHGELNKRREVHIQGQMKKMEEEDMLLDEMANV